MVEYTETPHAGAAGGAICSRPSPSGNATAVSVAWDPAEETYQHAIDVGPA